MKKGRGRDEGTQTHITLLFYHTSQYICLVKLLKILLIPNVRVGDLLEL